MPNYKNSPDGSVPIVQESCVYAIIDTHTDTVLYVGESKRLFGRIKNHLYEKSDSCLFGRLVNDPTPPFEPEQNWRKRLSFDYWKVDGGRKKRQQVEDEMVRELNPVYPPK